MQRCWNGSKYGHTRKESCPFFTGGQWPTYTQLKGNSWMNWKVGRVLFKLRTRMRPLHFIFPLVLPISLNSCTSLTSYILVNLYKRLSRTTWKSYQRNTRIGTEATELTILWFLVMTGYGIHFLLYIGGSHISHAFIGFSLRSLNRRKISLKITQLL